MKDLDSRLDKITAIVCVALCWLAFERQPVEVSDQGVPGVASEAEVRPD